MDPYWFGCIGVAAALLDILCFAGQFSWVSEWSELSGGLEKWPAMFSDTHESGGQRDWQLMGNRVWRNLCVCVKLWQVELQKGEEAQVLIQVEVPVRRIVWERLSSGRCVGAGTHRPRKQERERERAVRYCGIDVQIHTCCQQWHDSARCTYEHSRIQWVTDAHAPQTSIGQESGDKTACTKNSWRLLAMGNQRAVFLRRQLQFRSRY